MRKQGRVVMQNIQQDPVAIVGIGCRFPQADDPRAFWKLLSEGGNAIHEVPASRWNVDAVYDPDSTLPGKTTNRWGGFLDQIDQFDWRALHMHPREVKHMDPQQRLLLEVAWEALEDAGLPFEQIAGTNTSVTIGINWSDYFHLLTRNWSQLDAYAIFGNGMCFAANRLSYLFDLTGPSLSVDTGCTSSLMSVYQACQSLWNGEASLALAGGVNLILSPEFDIMLSQAGLLSRDGQCKTFDARADGFVRGEGAGIVVLKLLSQVQPSDRIYALIRGVTANHNGHNEWMIAARRSAQEALLRTAYHKAGVDPADVDYVELNGTGFLQGDAIEAQALGSVLSKDGQRAHPCLVGSVKTNIGHLESAAGIAGLIKVALALHHQKIPPTLHIQTINPDILLQNLHLAPQQEMSPWPEKDGVPLAGVTALSMSGANVHTVLAAHPVPNKGADHDQQVRLLPLSAQSVEALYAQATAMRDFLAITVSGQCPAWQDICYTASVRRTHHEYRLAVAASSAQEAADALSAFLQKPQYEIAAFRSQLSARTAALEESVLRSQNNTAQASLGSLGTLYMQGENIDWPTMYSGAYMCVSLPTYQWQRERFWPEWLDTERISTPPEKWGVHDLPEPTITSARDQYKEQSTRSDFTNLSVEDELAQRIVSTWQELLGRDQIEPHANFFKLGGDSLLARQLLARLRQTCQVELTITAIFENPTLAEFTEIAIRSRTSTNYQQIQPLENGDQQSAEQLLATIHQLTNEEVAVLLKNIIGKEN
ncbi:PKS and KAsynt_C_assoc domain-containing protein [Ktedonobacteria bacterium brp13]|nr:PKS and KAsynt_C_assoc domain-containing protein [Ktedonobacteria bacterium brp13]